MAGETGWKRNRNSNNGESIGKSLCARGKLKNYSAWETDIERESYKCQGSLCEGLNASETNFICDVYVPLFMVITNLHVFLHMIS